MTCVLGAGAILVLNDANHGDTAANESRVSQKIKNRRGILLAASAVTGATTYRILEESECCRAVCGDHLHERATHPNCRVGPITTCPAAKG